VSFPTIEFAAFFAVVFVVSWALMPHPSAWRPFILAASYFFYGWVDWRWVLLLMASSVVNTVASQVIARSPSQAGRKRALTVAIVFDLTLLGVFKYLGFFVSELDGALDSIGLGSPLPLVQIVLPIGISFFTFQAISYVADVYRGVTRAASLVDVAILQAFFPHLVAGPIVRANELLPQLRTPRDPRTVLAGPAIFMIVGGLLKKTVIADELARRVVDPVYNDPAAHSGAELTLAFYGFAGQIYCDFSGYTDMAIGLALLLGFQLPQNFNRPYLALSLQDFWRRWHMTLSRWLRDYLYIPLGGSRRGKLRTYLNIFITMLLGGLWHGAAWNFVVWGGIHGVGQVIGHARRDRRAERGLPEPEETPRRRAAERFVTFHIVCLGWIFFRAGSIGGAFAMLKGLVTQWGPAPLVTLPVLGAIALGVGVQYLPHRPAELLMSRFSRLKPAVQGAVLGASLLIITTLGPQGVAPFIYFQF
jgi:alginate O-acetyltransferase complex protein AlgI